MEVASKRYPMQIRMLLVLSMLGCVECYPSFRYLIPNGFNVPNPCNSSFTWNGVGHFIRQGSGARNFFGIDFLENGAAWNSALCRLDSDGDGRTNGEELGDPGCLWTPGATPELTSGITHPGICEPLDSEKCMNNPKTQNPKCGDLEFQCEAVAEEDVERRTVQMTGQDVTIEPNQSEYRCMRFQYPTDGDFHMIAALPSVDSGYAIEMMLFGCSGTLSDLNEPYQCFMAQGTTCAQLIAVWSGRSDGLCMGPKSGHPVGTGDTAYKFGVLKVQYFNPMGERKTIQDTSGFSMAITKTKRMYDAGAFMIGQAYLQIPPGEEDYAQKGKCAAKCTSVRMSGPINITSLIPHMHYLGRKAEVTKIEPGKRITYIAYEGKFNTYQHRPLILSQEVQVSPGEEIEIRCHYNTMSKDKTTFFGFTRNNEMCQGFITYYPKENFSFEGGCTSSGDILLCDPTGPLVDGCELTKLMNSSDPEVKARYQLVHDNCRPGVCLKECVEVVKEIFSHPCYSGTMKAVLVNAIKNESEGEDLFAHARFLAYASSCDTMIAEEKCEKEKEMLMTAGAKISEMSFITFAVSVIVNLFLLSLIN